MAEVSSQLIEVCPFRISGDRGEYLLLHRSAKDPLYPVLWQFVTGRVEEGETSLQAALRELREETGAEHVRLWVVPAVNSFYDPDMDRSSIRDSRCDFPRSMRHISGFPTMRRCAVSSGRDREAVWRPSASTSWGGRMPENCLK
jgi:8-oxo-dGTP pyrophosphatase MutT (NUDIX family)